MRTHRPLAMAAMTGTLFILPGCFRDGSPTGNTPDDQDQQAIEYVVLDEQAPLTDADVMYWDDDPGTSAAPIETMGWRRELQHFERTVSIEIEHPEGEPATANVDIDWKASGLLHLFAPDDGDRLHVTKPFENSGERSLVLQRARRVDALHRGWRLVALSGVAIDSPGSTRHIQSVRIQAGPVDETIENVTDLVPVGEILTLPVETEVTITVVTGDASDQVYLHRRDRHARVQLESQGDGSFAGTFRTGILPGPRHLVVDVLSESTLFDDEAAYDNVAWGIPMRLRLRDGSTS